MKKGVLAIGPDAAILAAIFICVLLVIAAVAATARQLGPGRQQNALASSRPGSGGPALPTGFSEDPDSPPGVPFRRYEVVEMAHGGVGTVYRAVHPITGKLYAIKQLNRQFVSDQLVIDAFNRGAAMLMDLRHANIVKVYYYWTEPNDGWQDHYVVMEYLPGNTMHDLIRREAPLPFDAEFMRIITGIADAITYLHSFEIVHRDIKPENFRLSEGRYKLLDFDTAFSRSHRGLMPQDGMPVGTPEYMSPEQARGANDIDIRADVYSFGMLLYELLTGTVPFTGAPSRVLIDQMETVPKSPRLINEKIPKPVADLILMALQKERDRRFQSITAVMHALESAFAAAHPETKVGE